MSTITDDSFKINIKTLRLLGLYPTKTNSILGKTRNFVLYFVFLVLPVILVAENLLSNTRSDILQTNFMVMYVSQTLGFTFKVLPFLMNGQEIQKCLNYFNHPRFVAKTEEEEKFREECVYICKRNSTIFFSAIVFALIVWHVQSQLVAFGSLPLDIWTPYAATYPSLKYYATLLYLVAVSIYDAFGGAMIDPMIGGLAYHATSQLKILKLRLHHVDSSTKNNQHKIVKENLELCIRLHKDILCFLTLYEECFSFPIFCQFASSTFLLCFSSIGVIYSSLASTENLKNIMGLIFSVFPIFFYCHYGTLLHEENNGLTTAIYMGDWYNYDVKIRKVLITVMERSKKPLCLTAGKVINLTIATFTSMIKTSYSLIAVLNNY